MEREGIRTAGAGFGGYPGAHPQELTFTMCFVVISIRAAVARLLLCQEPCREPLCHGLAAAPQIFPL